MTKIVRLEPTRTWALVSKNGGWLHYHQLFEKLSHIPQTKGWRVARVEIREVVQKPKQVKEPKA